MKAVQSQIVHVDDLQARRISAAENMQREDLSAIETIEAIVEIVDAELIQDEKYAGMGKTPADRVKALLGQLDSVRRSQIRGSEVCGHTKALSHKFVGQVEKIFKSLPKPLEWRSFYRHDLPILMDICEEVREISIEAPCSKLQGMFCLTAVLRSDVRKCAIFRLKPGRGFCLTAVLRTPVRKKYVFI
jgi:hypothetical protein